MKIPINIDKLKARLLFIAKNNYPKYTFTHNKQSIIGKGEIAYIQVFRPPIKLESSKNIWVYFMYVYLLENIDGVFFIDNEVISLALTKHDYEHLIKLNLKPGDRIQVEHTEYDSHQGYRIKGNMWLPINKKKFSKLIKSSEALMKILSIKR